MRTLRRQEGLIKIHLSPAPRMERRTVLFIIVMMEQKVIYMAPDI
jgi:hypothetical protein